MHFKRWALALTGAALIGTTLIATTTFAAADSDIPLPPTDNHCTYSLGAPSGDGNYFVATLDYSCETWMQDGFRITSILDGTAEYEGTDFEFVFGSATIYAAASEGTLLLRGSVPYDGAMQARVNLHIQPSNGPDKDIIFGPVGRLVYKSPGS